MPHPASGQDVDIADVVDDAARHPDGAVNVPFDRVDLDYSDAYVPDVAGETAEIADQLEFNYAQADFDGKKN